MTEYDHESAAFPESPLGDDLPPVQPPSAAFIVQLFVFPALIVMAVVAIWWMFGLIAGGQQDWHTLLQDLQSQNLLVRNRAMYGMAQVLDQDIRRGDQGQHLNQNREIAEVMTDQLMLELRKNSSSEEAVAIQEFLTRALGMMTAFDITAPALHMALEPQRDERIRKGAVISLSLVAGRAFERGEPLKAPETVDALVQLAADPLPVMRQSAAFALGLFDSPEAIHQLEVLLDDGDQIARVNAAVGLARHGSLAGFDVIRDSLKLPENIAEQKNPTDQRESSNASDDQFHIVRNILKVVNEHAREFSETQRKELIPLVEELANKHPEIRIRIDATSALNSLKAASSDAVTP